MNARNRILEDDSVSGVFNLGVRHYNGHIDRVTKCGCVF